MVDERGQPVLDEKGNPVVEPAPLEFVEYVIARHMGWDDVDSIPAHRVEEAIIFRQAEIDHAQELESSGGTTTGRMPGGAVR